MSNSPRSIDPAELPGVITSYLKAHQARDIDVAIRSYTLDATVTDEDRYDVTHHLQGNFPGGQVDLHFRFALRGDAIAQLVIEE